MLKIEYVISNERLITSIGVSINQQIFDGNVDMFLSCAYEPSLLENSCVP